jgi:hypothetical protein
MGGGLEKTRWIRSRHITNTGERWRKKETIITFMSTSVGGGEIADRKARQKI